DEDRNDAAHRPTLLAKSSGVLSDAGPANARIGAHPIRVQSSMPPADAPYRPIGPSAREPNTRTERHQIAARRPDISALPCARKDSQSRGLQSLVYAAVSWSSRESAIVVAHRSATSMRTK